MSDIPQTPATPVAPAPAEASPVTEAVQGVLNSPEMKAKAENPDVLKQIYDGIQPALKKLEALLGDGWEDVQTCYHMLFDKGFDLQMNAKVAIVAAFVYLISPIDIFPDFLSILGFVDDLLAISLALKIAAPEIARYRAWKAQQQG
jgi:uncharacterized membrane protein YkvA (DUF1232 family)